jgi:alkane 1-monooxygenase
MRDPATARRGESVYAFFLRSVSGQIRSAWNVEKIRLGHEGVSPLNPRNYVLSSIMLSFLLSALFYFLAGRAGLLVFVVQAFVANFLLEYTNYIEHYGLWREENVRVNAELSWQSDRVISRFILIDLSRHSDHHFYASKPYHTLRTYDESPVLPGGYASCFYIAILPPLWYKIIHPRLEKFNPGRIRLSESELK